MKAILDKALATQIKERFQTASEPLDAVHKALR